MTSQRLIEGRDAALARLVLHYRTELEAARAAGRTTGEGERLFENLMNEALDDLMRYRKAHPRLAPTSQEEAR